MYSREMKFCPGCKNACPLSEPTCNIGKMHAEEEAERKKKREEKEKSQSNS